VKAFVTGGTGFVGSHLVEALSRVGVEIFALIRNPKRLKWLKGLNFHILEGDLFSIPSLPGDLDVVYHLAALTKATKAKDYYTVNHRGTASLFESLSRQGLNPKIIQVSSLSASGPSVEGRPVREDDPPQPVSPYGRSKLLAEGEALRRKDKLSVVILRPGTIFGARDRDMLVLLKLVKRGILPKIFDGRLRVSLCYIKDVVRALLLCLRHNLSSGEILHIAAADPPSAMDIGQMAAGLMGLKPRLVNISPRVAGAAARMMEWSARLAKKRASLNRNLLREMKEITWVADVRKAAERLGFRAETPLPMALIETIGWYREQGWL
jgi:dihydroflavonol-4-reductase